MRKKLEEILEVYDQGCFSKVAQDDWNEENVKGYLAAQDDIRPFLIESIAQAEQEMIEEIRKRRDSLSISTKFAVMMMNQRGDAGKMAKELRELGGYQALDDLLASQDTNPK